MLLRRLLPLALLAAAGIVAVQSDAPLFRLVGPVAPSPSLATSSPAAPLIAVTPPPTQIAIRPIPDGYRIRIARLRIDLPIAEGVIQRDIDQQRTPEGYAFHLPGTAIPGEVGNSYIYSHARTGMFLSLWDARVGDEVSVSTPGGMELKYLVSEVRPRVRPSDISVAQPTEDERLTLQTSTGPNADDPRFVVIATVKR